MTHPLRQPGQTLADHQADMAAWMGVSAERMEADHDNLHRALSAWAGVPSHSLQIAAGGALTGREKAIADLEENAVLHTQRWLYLARGETE